MKRKNKEANALRSARSRRKKRNLRPTNKVGRLINQDGSARLSTDGQR